MKNMRRIASLLLALALVFSLAISASATNITINGGANGSEYAAYKLLNATNAVDTDGNATGKYAYTLNEKYTTILKSVTKKDSQDDIIAYIAALTTTEVQKFANDVYAAIQAANPTISADYTTNSDKFENVNQGYYLIAETKVGDNTDTFSLVMLDTAGLEDIDVTTKEDKPTVEKKIVEGTNKSDYTDKGVGDSINYEITGTVSSKYADYANYYYSFSDTMGNGLSLVSNTDGETPDYTDTINVTINNVDVTDQFKISATEHSFTATANLKKLTGVEITSGTKIIVTYTAVLNENAVSGSAGNKNEVILKYENNPYNKDDGTPENPGETPKDTNIVFTFDAIVNKVDGDGNALTGAGFTLYKKNSNNSWEKIGEEVKGENLTKFEFKKLDAGTYKLEETTVPAGYNKADDIIFEIVPTYADNQQTTGVPTLTALVVKDAQGNDISYDNPETEVNEAVFTATVGTGEVSTNVVNQAGTELPSTGGVGTTMFYVIGSVLVLAAVVLLVTKKRMGTAE